MSYKKDVKMTSAKIYHERQRVKGIVAMVANPTYSKTFVSVSSYGPIKQSMKHDIGNETKGNPTCFARRNSQEKVNNFQCLEARLLQQGRNMPHNRQEKFPAPPAFEELSGLDLSHLSSEERAAILEVAARAKQIEQVETRRVKTIEKQVEDFSRSKQPASPQRTASGSVTSKTQQIGQTQHHRGKADFSQTKPLQNKHQTQFATSAFKDASSKAIPLSAKQQVGNVKIKQTTDVEHKCSFCNVPLTSNLNSKGQTFSNASLQELKKCTSCGRHVCKSCIVLSKVLAKKGEVLCKLCNKQRELAAKSNVWLQKRPASQLLRSASVDTSKNEGTEKSAKFSEQALRRRSYSADNSHAVKDCRKRTPMSLPEALMRQLSEDKEISKSKHHKQKQKADPQSKKSMKTESGSAKNTIIEHRPPNGLPSAGQDPLSKSNTTKISPNANISRMPKHKAPTEHTVSKSTIKEPVQDVENPTLSSTAVAEIRKPNVNITQSHRSTPNSSPLSFTKDHQSALPNSVQKPKDEASSVLEKLKRQFPLQATKPDTVRKEDQPSGIVTTVQEKSQLNSTGINPVKEEIQVDQKSTKHSAAPNSSKPIVKPSESITKPLESTNKPMASVNQPLESAHGQLSHVTKSLRSSEPVTTISNEVSQTPLNKGRKSSLDKQAIDDTRLAKSNEQARENKKTGNSQQISETTHTDMESNKERKDGVNRHGSYVAKFYERGPSKEEVHDFTDKFKTNVEGRADAHESFEPLPDYPTGSEHPLAKQNVPSAYVARRSSIEEAGRSMPNATSICSSLAESEGPAEWSVDELDDNDTFFLVTSSGSDKTNLPSGITKPSDLRSAVEENDQRLKEAEVEGLCDERNYDYIGYEDDTEGDFDQFLQDEQDALMEYTGRLKRVSLFHDLSSMASNNVDKQPENVSQSDFDTTNEKPPAHPKPPSKVQPSKIDLAEEKPKTSENHKKLKRTDSITNQVKSTISRFENQAAPAQPTERTKPSKFLPEQSAVSVQQQVTAEDRFAMTTPIEKPAVFSMVKSRAVSNFYPNDSTQTQNKLKDEITVLKNTPTHQYKNHTSNTTAEIDTSTAKRTEELQKNTRNNTETTVTKPIPAKRKTSTIPAITITNEADTKSTGKVPANQKETKQGKTSEIPVSKQSEFEPVSGDKKTSTSVDSTRNRLNRSPLPASSSVYVNKFGSKVLQPANTSKLPISPLVTSSNSINELPSQEGKTQQQQQPSSKKVWAVHKAGYFDSDSESGGDDDDEDEKELLKFTSSVPIHPEEMEEYDSAKTVPSASPSSKMFFRRTTSTDNFEDLLKRATDTPRPRKSGATARIDKIASRFAKKSDEDNSSMARSVSLSPPNGGSNKTETSDDLSHHGRRMSEPLICQTDNVLKPEPSNMSLSPSRGSFSSLPSPNSLASSSGKKDLVVNLNSAKEFGVSTHTQSNIFCDSGQYSSMVRCVSCGVLADSSTPEQTTHVVKHNDEVKIEPPRSLEMSQTRTKKCQSVSSSTQVTPDQPQSGFSFLPSVDLCQLTALIEALKNVQGISTSTGSLTSGLDKHNPTSTSITYEPRSVLYKDASTETSLTGEPVILANDRVLSCGRYREVDGSCLSPRRRPNTAHACIGTQESITVKRDSHGVHADVPKRRELSKYDLPPSDEYSWRYDYHEGHVPSSYLEHEGDSYLRNPRYPAHDIYERAYPTTRPRPRYSRETYAGYSRYAEQDRYLPQHYSSFPFDQNSEYDRTPRSQYQRQRTVPKYRGEVSQAMGNSRKQLLPRDPYYNDAYQQEYLNEMILPENLELEVQPPRLNAGRQENDGYDHMEGNLTTLPNDDFSLKRSASVPAVARQDVLSQAHIAQPIHANAGTDMRSCEVSAYRNLHHDQPSAAQYNCPPQTNQPVSQPFVPSSQYNENQDFYGRSASQGSSYTLASLDSTAPPDFSNDEIDETHRSPSKRTLPQPPEDDEFRWRYNNNKRFNTLTSGRSRNNYKRDYNTEPTARGSTRLRQTMEDLDQEEKELDLRLRYLELGRQTRSTSQSSLSSHLYPANTSSTPLRSDYDQVASRSINDDSTPLTPSSRQASILNISEASQSKPQNAQRNYVIVDDVTQIVTSGPQPTNENRTQKRNPQGNSRADGHQPQPQNEVTNRYRGDNNRVYSGTSQGDYSSSHRIPRTNQRHSTNQQLPPSRRTMGNGTFHARYALQDSEELERAFALSQNNYVPSQSKQEYITPQPRYTENVGRQNLESQTHEVAIESQIDQPREEDMRTVVSDTEAYHLRHELNDWFDKPRDSNSRGGRGSDAMYAEFSNDQMLDN